MDLRTLNTLKAGDRIMITRDDMDVGTRAGDLGTVTAIARRPEAVLPTVYIQLDSAHPDLHLRDPNFERSWDNELMLSPECYCDLAAANSSIDPNTIVASMEKADAPRGLGWLQGNAEAA
jgi:hypothetical protein